MALLAGLWEVGGDVTRIIRALEIREVARHTSGIRTGKGVIAVYVTLRAL